MAALNRSKLRGIEAGDPNKLYNTHTTNASAIIISGVYSPVYAGGFMLLNYFAKKVSNTR